MVKRGSEIRKLKNLIEQISLLLDKHSSFDNVMILGHFNLEPIDIDLISLTRDPNLYNLIKHLMYLYHVFIKALALNTHKRTKLMGASNK